MEADIQKSTANAKDSADHHRHATMAMNRWTDPPVKKEVPASKAVAAGPDPRFKAPPKKDYAAIAKSPKLID